MYVSMRYNGFLELLWALDIRVSPKDRVSRSIYIAKVGLLYHIWYGYYLTSGVS